jgi:iron complex outermembrane recepter protein
MTTIFRKTRRPLALSGLHTVLVASTVFGSFESAASVLEEVVVVAQKREQNLQDVGIAVTAFSGDQMRDLGFTEAIDVVAHSPGLEVSGSGGGTIATYSIRGVTQNDYSGAQEGPVAVYVDEAYISQNAVTNFSLFDVERVEVLRGPQGTLFGRNATGGLVHYLTVRPSQESEGFAEITIGEQNRRRIEAAAGGALSDAVSGRLAGVYNEGDGLIENDIGPDTKSTDDYSIRGQLLIESSDVLDILLKAQYGKEDSIKGGYSHQVAYGGEFANDPEATDFFGYVDADGDPYTGSFDYEGFRKVDTYDLSMHINWDIGEYSLTSISNYQDIEHGYGEDSDVSPNSVYHYEGADDVQQFSQEFRLSFEGDKSRSIVGLFYLNIDGDYDTFQFGDIFFGPGFIYELGAEQETETVALFGQTEIDLSDTLALTLGLRLNRDEKDYAFSELGVEIYRDDFSNNDWGGKIQLDYRPNDDWLWYAGLNRGIKSGGFNMPLAPPADPASFPYDGEVLNSFEVGFKTSLTDNTRLNVAAYYYDYEDYQAFTFDGFVALLFNANAEMYGAEIELVTTPIEGLDILLGAAFLDAEVTDVPASISPTGTEDAVLAPELSLNGLVRYSWPAFGGSIAVQGDFTWKDDHNFNLAFTPVIKEDSYGIVNARISYATDDDTWAAAIFVKNLTDEDYRSFAFDTTEFFGALENVPGVERWFGANIRYRW